MIHLLTKLILVGLLPLPLLIHCQILTKCGPPFIQPSFWVVPTFLRQFLHVNDTDYFDEKFGSKFYNFTLIQPSPSPTQKFFCDSHEIFNFSINHSNNDTIKNPPEFSGNQINYLHFVDAPGYLQIGRRAIHPHNFCVAQIYEDKVEFWVCQNSSPVIPKCCELGQVIHEKVNGSTEHYCDIPEGQQQWTPFIYGPGENEEILYNFPPVNYEIKIKQLFDCGLIPIVSPDMNHLLTNQVVRIKILENGSTLTHSNFEEDGGGGASCSKKKNAKKTWTMEPPGQFCVDGHQFPERQTEYEATENNQILLRCAPKNDQSRAALLILYAKIYFGAFILSAICLLLIVMVHCLTWSHQNVHGWTVTLFSLVLALAHISAAIASGYGIWRHPNNYLNSAGCIAIGVCAHYFFISSFAWMTVLCFDLWSTISNMTPRSARSKEWRRFIGYSCFGFGIPLLVVLVSLILENLIDNCDPPIILPEYGKTRCYLGDKSQIYYAVIVNGILFGLNILFALLTISFLMKVRRYKIRSTKESTSEFFLFAKLFVVCGFSWIFELVSSFPEEKVTWYWAIFDLYNFLQAILLFWIFVLKKETVDRLSQEYKIFRAAFNFISNKKSNINQKETDPLIHLNQSQSTNSPMTSSTVTGF